MNPNPQGIPAAPNRSQIKARILRAEQDERYPDKWLLELEILETRSLSGPNFARPGQQAKGFTFAQSWDAPLPATVEAEAEYIGGAQSGQFHLITMRFLNEGRVMKIEGEIRFTEILTPFNGATVIVRVEDSSRADAASIPIAEQRIASVSRQLGDQAPVPFSIELPDASGIARYSLRAHVDVDASGEISRGDYVSTHNYPLASATPSSRFTIAVQPVR